MATLSQMASSPSPKAYLPKFLSTVAVACVLSGALLQLSPAPAAPLEETVEAVGASATPAEVGGDGPGLMRHEKPVAKAPVAPHPKEWGQMMRKEAPVAPVAKAPVAPYPKEWGQLMRKEAPLAPVAGGQMGQSPAVFLLAAMALIGFTMKGKGTLAHMASSSSSSAYFPKFLALVVVACFLAGVMLNISPIPDAQGQLMRKEALAPADAGQSSGGLFALLAVLAVLAFATQGQGTLAQMASSPMPSALVPKFIAAVLVACLLASAALLLSPSAEEQGRMMRSEAPVEANQAGQSSRVFFLALFGAVALGGFAMQAKETFMQLVNLGDVQKHFNIKLK